MELGWEYEAGDWIEDCEPRDRARFNRGVTPILQFQKDGCPKLGLVQARLPIFAGLVEGYLSAAGPFLNAAEVAHLALSGHVITFEIGLRFLTGDVYFKIKRQFHVPCLFAAPFGSARYWRTSLPSHAGYARGKSTGGTGMSGVSPGRRRCQSVACS